MTQLLLVQVLRGYIGDRNSRPIWGGRQPFDVLGSGYQRPFELATLRLFHMYGVLSMCKGLGTTLAAAARLKACLMLCRLPSAYLPACMLNPLGCCRGRAQSTQCRAAHTTRRHPYLQRRTGAVLVQRSGHLDIHPSE